MRNTKTIKNYRIVQNQQDLDELSAYLAKHEIVSYDIETTSKDEIKAELIGIGVSCGVNEGWYIPIKVWDCTLKEPRLVNYSLFPTKEEEDIFIQDFHQYLLNDKKLIGHNIVYDVTVIYHRYGINLIPAVYSDTILLKHTVDEERPFALKDLAHKYKEEIGLSQEETANQEQLELKENVLSKGGRWSKAQKDMYMADLPVLAKYCCADTDLTFRLFEYFSRLLKKEDLEEFFYNQEVMPLYKKCTIPMKMRGVYVDVPYFKELEKELECGIIELENRIFDIIKTDIEPKVRTILDKYVPVSKSGQFAIKVLQHYKIDPPINGKTGKPTLAKKPLQSLFEEYPDNPALRWLCYEPIKACPLVPNVDDEGNLIDLRIPWLHTKPQRVYEVDPDEPLLPRKVIYAVKKEIYVGKKPNLPHVFNLSSNDHLRWLIFKKHKCEPKKTSKKTGDVSVDAESLEQYGHLSFIPDLLKLKKEDKILNTYVRPILALQVNGWIYPSMQQWGTTSGRYSCADPNFQNLPSEDLRIKKGIIAPPGYKLVNADFSALEARIFSWVSGDPSLIDVWKRGAELYSKVAIEVFDLKGYSDMPGDKNFLKEKMPKQRDNSKVFALASVYGANAWKIAAIMKIDPKEAQEILDKYFTKFPYLQDYMQNMEILARERGKVWTQFGRIRHLPDALKLYRGEEGDEGYGNRLYKKWLMTNGFPEEGESLYYKFRNMMNNAKNFPIQGTAAHITNHAMIKMSDELKAHKIDGWVALQIHDEICCIVREDQASKTAELLKDSMENNFITNQISVPMESKPMIGDRLAEVK